MAGDSGRPVIADRVGNEVRVHTLFATEPKSEHLVRDLIDRALSAGQLHGPDGARTQWQLCSSQRSVVSAEEGDYVQRLVRS